MEPGKPSHVDYRGGKYDAEGGASIPPKAGKYDGEGFPPIPPQAGFRGNVDNDASYEDLVHNESVLKEKALNRIKIAKRIRSGSNVSLMSDGSSHGFDGATEEEIAVALRQQHISLQPPNEKEEEGGELDGEGDGTGTEEDVRDQLFQAIPEPYPHTLSYQRIIITAAEEDAQDPDTIDACSKLKLCLDLRTKWLAEHPAPPQDELTFEDICVPSTPSRPESFVGEEQAQAQQQNSHEAQTPARAGRRPSQTGQQQGSGGEEAKLKAFRRRLPPKYEVFDQPLPHTISHLRYAMVDGVVRVKVIEPGTGGSGGRGRVHSDDGSVGLNLHAPSSDAAESAPVPAAVDKEGTGTKGKTEEDWSNSIFSVFSYSDYVHDYREMRRAIFCGPVLSYSYKRLELLAAKFNLHLLLNSDRELEAQKSVPHRDMYNCRKVDTHVHHSACMNQKHLLRFIKHKLKRYPHDKVIHRDGKQLSLGEVFKSLNLTAYDLSIDTLDMHAHNTFHRFDRFNLKYNPAGQSRLREIFLKTDNAIDGSYLADITKEVISDLEASKYTLVEWRISIYGRNASEWDRLAAWFYNNRLAHENVRWLIQIPRLYDIYKSSNTIESFGQMLKNIFVPLFEVSLNPAKNPKLHTFLMTVVGIDSVDDESRPEFHQLSESLPPPDEWTAPHNPPYAYWMYYLYANLCTLNKLRASRGLSTFQLRPHCGEAGDVDHLVASFLVAHQINHGILLRKNAGLQFLYYLAQVGIAMSPLSNNKLFLDYNKNPFPKYFCIGMNVSLSTDDPLMLHFTKDALLEEYSVAAQVWKLSAADQCEIARNSVLQSGFEEKYKRHFLGKDYSDIRETNVPEIRLMFRKEALQNELQQIETHYSAAIVEAAK